MHSSFNTSKYFYQDEIEFVCLSLTWLVSQKDNSVSVSPFVDEDINHWRVSGRVTLMSLFVGMVDTVPETRIATIYGKVEIGLQSMGKMKTLQSDHNDLKYVGSCQI